MRLVFSESDRTWLARFLSPCRSRHHLGTVIYISPPSAWHGSLTIEILPDLRFALPALPKKFPRKYASRPSISHSMASLDGDSFVAFGIDFGTT